MLFQSLVHNGDNLKVFAEIAKHGHDLNLPDAFKHRWVCLGYRIEAEGKVVAISGDGVASRGLDRLAKDADVLVQCCYLAKAELTNWTMRNLAEHTLACSDTAGKIAQQARVKKLVLTHLRQKSDALLDEVVTDVAQDYDGPIVLGRDLFAVEV